MLGDPFSHFDKRVFQANTVSFKADAQIVLPTGQTAQADLVGCYHWILDANLAPTLATGYRMNIVEKDVAVLSFWQVGTNYYVRQDFYHENADGSWSQISDSFNMLQTGSIAQTDISSTVAAFDATYGTHTSLGDYDTCFYRNVTWQRTQMPVWVSDDSECETCGSGNIPLKINIYEWTKGTDIEYRSSTNCSNTNSCCQETSTDLTTLQTSMAALLVERCTDDEDNGGGGGDEPECTDNDDCEDGYVCVNQECVEKIEGCTDPQSNEYDSSANVDDGTCISCKTGYEKDVAGLCLSCIEGYSKDAAGNCYEDDDEETDFPWLAVAGLGVALIFALS